MNLSKILITLFKTLINTKKFTKSTILQVHRRIGLKTIRAGFICHMHVDESKSSYIKNSVHKDIQGKVSTLLIFFPVTYSMLSFFACIRRESTCLRRVVQYSHYGFYFIFFIISHFGFYKTYPYLKYQKMEEKKILSC